MSRKSYKETSRFYFSIAGVIAVLFILMDLFDNKTGRIPDHLLQVLCWLALAFLFNVLDRVIRKNRYQFVSKSPK